MFAVVCVALTIFLTVYGQIVIKWQLQGMTLPDSFGGKLLFLVAQFLNPWVLSSFISAFMASLCWMAAMTRVKLSDAYPYTSLSLVLVLALSHFFFGDALTSAKLWGTLLVVAGLVTLSR